MEWALRMAVKDQLRPRGFSGSFPHLRQRSAEGVDLISFQFHSAGGSFVVEVAGCGPLGFTTSWGKHLAPSQVRALDITWPRPRLGSPTFPMSGDHWFVFGPRSYESGADEVQPSEYYQAIASDVVGLIDEQGESFWRTVVRADDRQGRHLYVGL